MTTIGKTTFTTKAWDEKPYVEIDGERKLTRTRAAFAYEGDLEGEGTVEYLVAYSPNGVGNFVGLERIVGRVGGRPGSFVVQRRRSSPPHGLERSKV